MLKLTCREALILLLVCMGLGAVGILFGLRDGSFLHFMGEVHDFFWQFVYGLVKLCLILIGIATCFGVAYGFVVLHREWGVVRPNKYGKAQAIKSWRGDPFLLPQDGESSTRDMELSRLVYQVMQEREKAMQQQYKALEFQRRYEEKALPPPSTREEPVVEVKGPPEEQVKLSPHYTMHIDEMLSQRGLLVGTSGSGKSSGTAVIAENFMELDVPFMLMDTEGEYLRLPQFMGQGEVVDATLLGPENALAFGRSVAAQHKQVVINLLSYEAEEAAQVMAGALTGARMWEEERANDLRVAVMVFLTEAHKWFPQYVQENQLPPEIYTSLCAVFFKDLVRRGRKRGMGLIFDTQKLQEVDKRLLQPDWKICLRQTEDRSLERYNKWGITNAEAMNLRNGEGFIYSTRVTKLKTRLYRRRSPDDSQSPGIASIRNHVPETSEIWTPRGRNTGELSSPNGRNCAERSQSPLSAMKGHGEPLERIERTERGNRPTHKFTEGEISDDLYQQIQGLYATGMNRTDIRDALDLNGDEYWMVKQVCNEYDQQRKRKYA
jgi:hypothetical protein